MKRAYNSIIIIRMKKLVVLFLLLSFLLPACVEQIDLYENEPHEYKIVLDGTLSNEAPPYYFRLTKTAPFTAKRNDGIIDALIVISDSQGVNDTLKAVEKDWAETDVDGFWGIYESTKIEGREGETYHLQIDYDQRRYEATETMPFATQLDSVSFTQKYLASKKEYVFCPLVNFHNAPERKDYYLFTYTYSYDDYYFIDQIATESSRIWPFSILKDDFLPENVTAFNLNDGEAPLGSEEGLFFHFSERDSSTILLYTLPESCYLFYEDLIKQCRYDGGAFTPAPTSARGNISNGALGLFKVAAIDTRIVTVWPE